MPSERSPDIDFARIRPYGRPASRAGGFEELSSILIEQGVIEWPDGTRFSRFGNPDGGREGRGVLPDGNVWGWQSKYLFTFDASAAGQVNTSFLRALDTEPSLTRYIVAFPFDLPAGDTETQASAFTRWTTKVAEWEAAAKEKGREVEIAFVGAHELLTVLTESQHAGRARYWFAADVLTPEWQARRVEEAVAKVGPRYSPRLHVEVDTIRAFDAVGRTAAYAERWQRILAGLRESRQWPWRAPDTPADAFGEALTRCASALDAVDETLELVIAAVQSIGQPPPAEGPLDAALEALWQVDGLLHEHHLSDGRYFVGDAGALYEDVRKAVGALQQGNQLARGVMARAAVDKRLLLTGRAGVGKTHLLCDLARRRIASGLPTVLLLGEDFDARSLLSQAGELSQLGGSVEDVLAVLDAASEAADCVGLFMIDALNDSEEAERWQSSIRALVAAARHYPRVALVVSCRTEFVGAVLGDHGFPRVEHAGFAEETGEAVQRFTREYGLEPPRFPVLNPEFGNPLFLKLTCEALATLGATWFPLGSAGIATVCDAFLKAVNKRLSAPGRCDYDERADPVGRCVRELALLGRDPMDRADVERVTDNAVPGRSWSRSLMRGMIAEGVLTELSDGRIAFGYQRLGDVTRAASIADRPLADARDWVRGLGDDVWRERGVLGALAVIVPERHQAEIIDLAIDAEGKVSYEIVDSFLESLLLRSPDSVSPLTAGLVERLLSDSHRAGETWDRLIRLACIPGHPLNAEWLHPHLASQEIADRDQGWSNWLVGGMDIDDQTAIRQLVQWAWPHDPVDSGVISDDVAALAVLVLGWFLTTTDRRVRDRATKAIVSVAERAPVGFATAVARFRSVNDPYVIERLTAAACGVVLRSGDTDTALRVADGVRELVGDAWPHHLMTRDFIRRVFAVARARGWQGPDGLPPYGAEWPIPARPREEIEALAGPPDYAYGGIWYSLAEMGDFGRYVLQSALRDVAVPDPEALEDAAERAVFDRALALGWTPERFGDTDRGRSGGRDGVVERVGKKYQWIGFNEVLGAIADNHEVKPTWSETAPRPYAYAEQLVWRDIDPTVLARKPARPVTKPLWFSPAEAAFPPGITEKYPDDVAGVPDPLDLIAVTDPQGIQQLVLMSHPSWQQPLAPEVEARRPPRLTVWMQIHGYLTPVSQADAVREWARGKDWHGRWMPEVAEPHNVLLGAHPDDPEWAAAEGDIERWDDHFGGPRPAELLQCAAWYGGTGTSRDASAENETTGYVPTRRLLSALGLSRGVDFTWRDASGVAVHDPSVSLGGPGTLAMRRDLAARLTAAGLTIFWTVLAGNELHHPGMRPPSEDYRWVSASASCILTDGQVEQIEATAARYRPGPSSEHELDWVTRPAERRRPGPPR